LQVVARRKRRIACSYSRCSRTSLQLSRLALIFSAHALFLLPPRSFYRPVTTFSARRSSWRPTPISYTCRRRGRSGGRIRHSNFLMRYLGDFLDCAQLVNNTAKPLPWSAGHPSEDERQTFALELDRWNASCCDVNNFFSVTLHATDANAPSAGL